MARGGGPIILHIESDAPFNRRPLFPDDENINAIVVPIHPENSLQ